jgi:hypothetical protein
MSGHVRVFGAIHNAESCAYDPERGVIVVPTRAANQRVLANDGFVSFIKHDGSVHTARRIGVQPPAARSGSDGLVIMPDGTKHVSSVFQGGVSRIRPGRPAELIARNIPNAAPVCYDAGGNQLVIPVNEQNGPAFVKLR